MSDWTGGVFALIGVAVGGGLTHFSAMWRAKQEKRWEVARDKRIKLEELSVVLDDFEYRYRELSNKAVLRLETGEPIKSTNTRIPTARLTTLIEFYARELLEPKKELDTLTEAYGKILVKVLKSSQLGDPEKLGLMRDALKGHRDIEDKCRELASKAADVVQHEFANLTEPTASTWSQLLKCFRSSWSS